MEYSKKNITTLTETLKGKINLLIIDDKQDILDYLQCQFCSPLFNIVTSNNFSDASAKIKLPDWSCWIVDLGIDGDDDGLILLDNRAEFPWIVVLSGRGVMELGGIAIKKGALYVFDKDPNQEKKFYDAVCRTAALGYLAIEYRNKKLPEEMLPLLNGIVKHPSEWEAQVEIKDRQLARICNAVTKQSLFDTIYSFYSIYYLLSTANPEMTKLNSGHPDEKFFMECIAQMCRYSDANNRNLLLSNAEYCRSRRGGHDAYIFNTPEKIVVLKS